MVGDERVDERGKYRFVVGHIRHDRAVVVKESLLFVHR